MPGANATILASVPAQKVLDQTYLEMRCRLLDLAALLDRIDRGGGASEDPRLARIIEGLGIVARQQDRAEKIQVLFSQPYDEAWDRPKPRG
jgi:hypothetical protein